MAEKNGVRLSSILRRYTNLAATVHLLREKKITLLDPATWDDKVDVAYMEWCSKSLRRPVLALCFCQGPQRYHHWRVYANGIAGVCIEFDKEWLLNNLDVKYEGLLHGNVNYRSYAEANRDRPDVLELPFLKRPAYKDEREYRIVRMFDEDERSAPARDYDIDIGCIRRIVLSPWMPRELCLSVKGVLMSIEGCGGLKVARSLLIEHKAWKKFGEDAYGDQENLASGMPSWMAPDRK